VRLMQHRAFLRRMIWSSDTEPHRAVEELAWATELARRLVEHCFHPSLLFWAPGNIRAALHPMTQQPSYARAHDGFVEARELLAMLPLVRAVKPSRLRPAALTLAVGDDIVRATGGNVDAVEALLKDRRDTSVRRGKRCLLRAIVGSR
jgi:hypothetical protein